MLAYKEPETSVTQKVCKRLTKGQNQETQGEKKTKTKRGKYSLLKGVYQATRKRQTTLNCQLITSR